MKTKKVVRKIFDTLNYSKKLKISSILPDRDSDYAILLELEDGSKFEIIIIPSKTVSFGVVPWLLTYKKKKPRQNI